MAERRDRGIALLAAVWLVAAVAVLAAGVARESRTVVLVASNEVAAATARAAAEAALARFALALAAEARGIPKPALPRGDGPPVPVAAPIRRDGTAYATRFGRAEVTLRVGAEAGKLDLNTADPGVLRAALAGLVPDEADGAAAAILAARARDGRERGVGWRLDQRALDRPGDIEMLPGVGPVAWRRLAPYFTTRSGLAHPDPLTAPAALFAALPLAADARAIAEAARAGRPPDWRPGEPETLTLVAEALLPDGTRARIARLVRVDPEEDPAVRVIESAPPPAAGAR